jgi:hypothetical protein
MTVLLPAETLSVPLNSAACAGANAIVIVHVAFVAMLLPHVVDATVKSVPPPCSLIVGVPRATLDDAMFVRVVVKLDDVPTGVSGKSSVPGVALTPADIAIPPSVTVCMPAPESTTSIPARNPAALGANVTVTVHVGTSLPLPAGSCPAQLSLSLKSPVALNASVSGCSPGEPPLGAPFEFATVIVAVTVWPTCVGANVCELCDTFR